MPQLLLALAFVAAAFQPIKTHDKPYWRAIVEGRFEVPARETAERLAPELIAVLGSTDPELRDDLAMSILTSWIYQKKFLGPEDLRPISATLQSNLRRAVGSTGSDEVLLRSFSALTLSVIAARDNETPFQSPAEFAQLLDAALEYFHDERDTRGFDPVKGWMHSAAHTSDLLKFLARSQRLPSSAQARILAAVLAKNRDAAAPFVQGEDERMARIAVSIVRRADFDREGFRAWLAGAQAAATFPAAASSDSLRAQQNVRHLLMSLWTELSVDERPSEGADAAKQALRDVLKTLY